MKIKCTVALESDIPEEFLEDLKKQNIEDIKKEMTEWLHKEWQTVNIISLGLE